MSPATIVQIRNLLLDLLIFGIAAFLFLRYAVGMPVNLRAMAGALVVAVLYWCITRLLA